MFPLEHVDPLPVSAVTATAVTIAYPHMSNQTAAPPRHPFITELPLLLPPIVVYTHSWIDVLDS